MIDVPINNTINSYHDQRFKRTAIKLLPGNFAICQQNEMIVTILGSCIAVCLYDNVLKIGGMNHFMLPNAHSQIEQLHTNKTTLKKSNDSKAITNTIIQNQLSASARYGNTAMELLINELIKLGSIRSNLSAKVFGGAAIAQSSINIGQKNIQFIHEYLALENISISNEDTAGKYPRKVFFVPSINEVYVKKIKRHDNNVVIQQENNYQKILINPLKNNVFYL